MKSQARFRSSFSMPVLITATVSKNQRSPHEIAELLLHLYLYRASFIDSSTLAFLDFFYDSSMRMKKLMLAFAVPVSGFPLKFHPRG
ncbi:unnamed protein product [Sphagnum troendelagicum]|uniref:Uncharacterized protein n=1 Tax=Sphagnum troendelagicum TaxID=128251 RepID=A0ABP0TH89_9BRYO